MISPGTAFWGQVNDGTGSVASFGTGSAEYLFIPTRDAAPNAPAIYRIGGSLRYLDGGQEVVVPLVSAPITVYPEARLQLHYFQTRDVFADDPFTDEVEPSEPFALGLLALGSLAPGALGQGAIGPGGGGSGAFGSNENGFCGL